MSAVYRFGPFLLDSAAYQLFRDRTVLPMSPKGLDLLLLFASKPGQLLTKDDILHALWPDVAVTDNALTQVVSELRQALGDNAAAPTYVETVPRRGYRFIAAVTSPTSEVAQGPGAHRPTSEVGGSRAPQRSIAVKDFANVTGDAEVAWLAAGIAETVTNDLRAIRDLRVIDRVLVSDAGRETARDASAFKLDLLVVGSFQRSGAQLRITARAVDVATQEALANAKADGLLTDVFQLQDDIVTQLTLGLRLTITPVAAARIGTHETSNLDAYRAVTEGRLKLETLDPARIAGAIADFDHAIKLDAKYALAHVGLAHAKFWRFQSTRARTKPAIEDLVAAIGHARRAIELDSYLAEAHSALAFLLASADRSDAAVAAGRLAVALEPGNWRHQFRLGFASWGEERLACFNAVVAAYPPLAYAYLLMASVHVARGDMRHADEILRRGATMAPAPAVAQRFPGAGLHWLRGLILLANGDPLAAGAAFEDEIAATSTSRGLLADEYAMDAHAGHGFALLAANDAAGAATMFEKALGTYPDHARSLLGLTLSQRLLRRRKAADRSLAHAMKAIEQLREQGRRAEAALSAACAEVVNNRADGALTILETMLRDIPEGAAGWTIPVEPLLAPLRSDPRFTAILARLAERAR